MRKLHVRWSHFPRKANDRALIPHLITYRIEIECQQKIYGIMYARGWG